MSKPNLPNMNSVDLETSRALDKEGQADDNLIRLSTGVILLAKQVNPNTLIRVMTATKRPEPPMVFYEVMGKSIENFDDPDYISRVQAWQMDYANRLLNVLVGVGTELHSKPKNMPGPDDKSWIGEYSEMGLPINPESKNWRYITWVLFKAAVNEKDNEAITTKVKQTSGVKEADARDAENFPGSN